MSVSSGVWPNLHFNVFQLLLFPVIPRDATVFDVSSVVIWPGEKYEPAVVEPPAGRPFPGTVVVRPVIVVPVRGAELHPIVAAESIGGGARVVADV